jgi:hypothetical protein
MLSNGLAKKTEVEFPEKRRGTSPGTWSGGFQEVLDTEGDIFGGSISCFRPVSGVN